MIVYPYSVLFFMDKDSAFFCSCQPPGPCQIHVCVYLFFLPCDGQTDSLGFHLQSSRDLVNAVMDSPGVHGHILFILLPLRAGREDEHFLYQSDTQLLSVPASKTSRAAFCAVEMVNGFSLSLPMKKHIKEITCVIVRCHCRINKTSCTIQYTEFILENLKIYNNT